MKDGYALSDGELYRARAEGFTLIEMIVAVTIMLVLLGITIIGYTSYNDRQKVKQAALTLKSDLRMARTNATSGKKPLSCNAFDETFTGYKVIFTLSSYTVVPLCSLGEITEEKVEVTLPSGVSFDPVPYTFTYYPLIKGVSTPPSTICLTTGTCNDPNFYSVTLTIDPLSGEVSD